MSKVKAKIAARLIHKKLRRFADFDKEQKPVINEAFIELYGIGVEEWEAWAYAD